MGLRGYEDALGMALPRDLGLGDDPGQRGLWGAIRELAGRFIGPLEKGACFPCIVDLDLTIDAAWARILVFLL